jgi:hypothetical protein
MVMHSEAWHSLGAKLRDLAEEGHAKDVISALSGVLSQFLQKPYRAKYFQKHSRAVSR